MFWLFLLLAPTPLLPEAPQPAAESLRWQADAACPDESWVRARIDEFRGPESLAGFEAQAQITLRDSQFALESRIQTPAGDSELNVVDPDCEALATAFALSVALALEPEIASESLEALTRANEPEPKPDVPEPEPALPPEIEPVLAPPDPVEPVDRDPRLTSAVSPWLALSFSGGWGLSPTVDLPLRLSIGARISSWEVSGGAVYLPPSERVEGGLTLLRTTGLGAQARVARVLRTGSTRLSVPLYAHAEAGWMQGRGVELVEPQRADASWWALGIGASLQVALRGPLFVALDLDGQVQPGRPAFAFSGPEGAIIHETSLLAFRAGVALGLRFGVPQNNSVARDQSKAATTRRL